MWVPTLTSMLVMTTGASAFIVSPLGLSRSHKAPTTTSLSMGVGDMFKKAFENEDNLPKQNAGLKNGPKYVKVTIDGKVVQAVAGQRLSQVCASAGVKISYNCQKGDCGTCEAFGDGKKIRVCQTIVPMNAASFTVKTKK